MDKLLGGLKTECFKLFQMIKNSIICILSVFLFISCANKQQYKVHVFSVKSGYGYTIKYGDKIIIKQNNIPAISKKKEFCTVNDAKKVANLVLLKLQEKQNPSVSLSELKSLQIAETCN